MEQQIFVKTDLHYYVSMIAACGSCGYFVLVKSKLHSTHYLTLILTNLLDVFYLFPFSFRLMTNELMSSLNMDGHGDKIAFRPTVLFEMIKG